MTETRVVNLATGAERVYSLPPRAAVIAAYAQGRGDWNTWAYAERYGRQVETGRWHLICGDWTARLPSMSHPHVTYARG